MDVGGGMDISVRCRESRGGTAEQCGPIISPLLPLSRLRPRWRKCPLSVEDRKLRVVATDLLCSGMIEPDCHQSKHGTKSARIEAVGVQGFAMTDDRRGIL
jgi:hypothetical protein